MAHFVAFCIGFQKNIPLQNPPGGGGGVYGSLRSTNDTIDGNAVNVELSIAIAENEGNIEDELNAPASSDEEEERVMLCYVIVLRRISDYGYITAPL